MKGVKTMFEIKAGSEVLFSMEEGVTITGVVTMVSNSFVMVKTNRNESGYDFMQVPNECILWVKM